MSVFLEAMDLDVDIEKGIQSNLLDGAPQNGHTEIVKALSETGKFKPASHSSHFKKCGASRYDRLVCGSFLVRTRERARQVCEKPFKRLVALNKV